MLRVYGPSCPDHPIDADKSGTIPATALWIDLCNPSAQEEKLAEQFIGHNIPTRADMLEIEPSSRLYEEDGVTVMTLWALHGTAEKQPGIDPISFLLTDQHLVTLRYVEPTSIRNFANYMEANPGVAKTPLGVMVKLLDAIVDRLADALEAGTADLAEVSNHIFDREIMASRRRPEKHYEAIMLKLGASQRLLAKIRESVTSVARLIGFLKATDKVPDDSEHTRHLKSLLGDANALNDHSNFVAENLNFLLDAALGMISLEQNFVMKIFSVVAVVLMPPTLIAGIYGMNFKFMPELEWLHGYTWSLGLMLASAVLPYLYARRRGWL